MEDLVSVKELYVLGMLLTGITLNYMVFYDDNILKEDKIINHTVALLMSVLWPIVACIFLYAGITRISKEKDNDM